LVDTQAALQANKATFFFQLVSRATRRKGQRGMLSAIQERELEKVNAFYLQKEAEVRNLNSQPLSRVVANMHSLKFA
jgi:CDK inhibitor PHO81